MIATIEGVLVDRGEEYVVVEVAGIGFHLSVPASVIQSLPSPGETVKLCTHLVFKEDSLTLYGFKAPVEKRLFLQLLTVSRVGPRMALAILSGVSAEKLATMISSGDVAGLTRVSGVGKKTAQRIIIDLKDKMEPVFGVTSEAGVAGDILLEGSIIEQASAALKSLGYSSQEARKALQYAHRELGDSITLEELIQGALKYFLR
ncbi:MAG: Holliday junction branch migration protein RuvA [bacterium]|jgi:Holliday junction DNA helicase RuvA|nr:Holliday junction branch migration protein RuvA [bacterium]